MGSRASIILRIQRPCCTYHLGQGNAEVSVDLTSVERYFHVSIASKFSGPHMYPERLETGCVQLFEETYPTHSKEQKMALEILHLTHL